MKDFDQTWRIKRLLAERGESITSMALKLGRPFGSVATNVHGYRCNPEIQAAIADYLGIPREELFGGNGNRAASC